MGRTNHPRYELMEKIRPDLVLTANWASPVMLNELVSRHFNVVSLNPESWDDVLRNIRLLGWLLDAEKAADEMSERLEQEMKRLLRAAADLPAVPTIYIETQTKPVAFAPDWVREMVEFSGGIDAYADRRGDRTDGRIVDIDDLQTRDPDAIVLAWTGADGDHDWEKVLDRPGWEDLRAVREERIYDVDSRHLLTLGGSIFYGLDDLTQIVTDVAQTLAAEEPY